MRLESSLVANGVITLTTDFGLHDPFVGIMKGCIFRAFPEARIVDLTHDIRPFWPIEAGFWLSVAARYFPKGSVHLGIVDPGVGSARGSLIVETADHMFLAPDNGLLGAVIDASKECRCYRLDLQRARAFTSASLSATFHGRDLYAPLAAALASRSCGPADIGDICDDFIRHESFGPQFAEGALKGIIVTIDHFGNAFTNISGDMLRGFFKPVMRIGERRLRIVRTYSDVDYGQALVLINSFNVLEIAICQGDAAATLRLARGDYVDLIEEVDTTK